MRGLTIKTMAICDNKTLQVPAVAELLQDLGTELSQAISENRVPGMDVSKLTVRQKNALYNFVTERTERREWRIRTGQ